MVTQSILKLGGELRPGDCFLNNSPYGDCSNTHHADFTYIVPVFYKDDLMFMVTCRGHQADCGNSIPSTYHPYAKDMYEEGAIDWPCVRIQQDYRDVGDIIKIAKARIRNPDLWYGDHLAQIGSVRTGEKRLMALCEKYGVNVVKAFCEQWQDYGKQRMIEEIRKLPKGSWYYEIKHDPLPGVLLEGVTIRVRVGIEPDEGYITVDLTENDDVNPCGLNLSRATSYSGAVVGVLDRLDPTIPHCEGALSRIRVKVRPNSCVGEALPPYSASAATTNVADRLQQGTQCCLNQATEIRGMAEAGPNFCPACGVYSGQDWRRGNRTYCNQFFNGMTCGAGVNGHDGWVTLEFALGGGYLFWMSVEIEEQAFPVSIVSEEFIPDSQGPGKWDSAPSCKFVIKPRHNPFNVAFANDGHINRAKGAKGGLEGWAAQAWKYDEGKGERSRFDLPQFGVVEVKTGEVLVSESTSGGGYGDPLERDPDLVCQRARAGLYSLERARDVYGVVLDTEHELFKADSKGTEKLRKKLKEERSRKGK
jgi:N-methylhydantoinase B